MSDGKKAGWDCFGEGCVRTVQDEELVRTRPKGQPGEFMCRPCAEKRRLEEEHVKALSVGRPMTSEAAALTEQERARLIAAMGHGDWCDGCGGPQWINERGEHECMVLELVVESILAARLADSRPVVSEGLFTGLAEQLAVAWDKGYEFGYNTGHDDLFDLTPNPYRLSPTGDDT